MFLKLRLNFISYIVLFLLPCTCFPQLGKPLITNYNPSAYKAHGQNWQIIKGPKSTIYSANSDGILSYNGVSWDLVRLPAYVIVRSLDVYQNRIFVGAQDQLGFLQPDSMGVMKYSSLNSIIPDSIQNFGNVWQVKVVDGEVYFLTRHLLLKYNILLGHIISTIKAQTFFHTMHFIDDKIYVQQPGIGFMQLYQEKLSLVPGCEKLKESRVYSVLKIDKNKILIGTRKTGLYLYKENQCTAFKTDIDSWLKKKKFYNSVFLNDSTIAIATLEGGCAIINKQGKLSQIINKKIGLQDNTVWHVYQDNENNLWLALNKGISKVSWPSPYTIFNESNGLTGNVQSITRFNDKIYAATSYGVFYLEDAPDHSAFKVVKGISTQCWNLQVINGRLFTASNTGIWEVNANGKIKLQARYNSWIVQKWFKDRNIIFVGFEEGVAVLRLNRDGTSTNLGALPGLNVDARTLATDSSGALFIGTTRSGIYKVNFKNSPIEIDEIKHFTNENGLPAMNNNLAFQTGDNALFTTADGLYMFDDKERLVALPEYQKYFSEELKESAFYQISQDQNNNLWINNGQTPAVFNKSLDGQISFSWKEYLSFPAMMIYTIYSDNNAIWIGGPEGIVRLDLNVQAQTLGSIETYIHSINFNNDSIVAGPFFDNIKEKLRVNYDNNSVRFKYHSGNYFREDKVLFQYMLENFDRDWSDWTNENIKDYTNLFEGDYLFKVRSQNIFGEIGNADGFPFVVLAPWYRTYWSYAFYMLVLLFSLVQAVNYQKIRKKHKALLEKQKLDKIRKNTEDKLRQQMAADFHDELGNKITRITLFSDLIKKSSKKIPDDIMGYFSKINENAQTLYSETRDFVWQLDPHKDALFDTIARLKNFGDQLFDKTGIEFEVVNNFKSSIYLKLNMDLRSNIMRILKEAMHNALKHASCNKVELVIYKRNGNTVFKVSDNGKGFVQKNNSDGNGIKNIQTRAQNIKADFRINSGKNGTDIELAISTPLGS